MPMFQMPPANQVSPIDVYQEIMLNRMQASQQKASQDAEFENRMKSMHEEYELKRLLMKQQGEQDLALKRVSMGDEQYKLKEQEYKRQIQQLKDEAKLNELIGKQQKAKQDAYQQQQLLQKERQILNAAQRTVSPTQAAYGIGTGELPPPEGMGQEEAMRMFLKSYPPSGATTPKAEELREQRLEEALKELVPKMEQIVPQLRREVKKGFWGVGGPKYSQEPGLTQGDKDLIDYIVSLIKVTSASKMKQMDWPQIIEMMRKSIEEGTFYKTEQSKRPVSQRRTLPSHQTIKEAVTPPIPEEEFQNMLMEYRR